MAPAGDNALEHTLRALRHDANDAGANEMLVDITPIAASAIEADIAARNFVEAERVMALLASANPDSLTVQSLQRRLTGATRALAAETQAQSVAAAAAAMGETVRAEDATITSVNPTRSAAAPVIEGRSEPTVNAVGARAEFNAIASDNEETEPPPTAASASERPAAPLLATSPAPSRTSEPVATFKVTPTYPPIAKKRRAEGWVELQFMVGADGMPRQVEVVRAEPPGMFDRSAVQALSRWKFRPAERDGAPVEARAKTTIGFKLG